VRVARLGNTSHASQRVKSGGSKAPRGSLRGLWGPFGFEYLLTDSEKGGLEGPHATLHGKIEAADGEVVIARVEGALLQVELLDAPPVNPVGTAIETAADDLELYPTGI
jgi:hypothetical protein